MDGIFLDSCDVLDPGKIEVNEGLAVVLWHACFTVNIRLYMPSILKSF